MAQMKRNWLPIALFVALLATAHAQTPEQAKTLDRKWADATMHADAAALNDLLADDLTYTHTGGNTQTKAEFIASVREKKIRYDSIEFEDTNARVYGNTAVITSRVHVKVTVDGRDVTLHPCFLHIWVKRNGRWQLVAHQATQIQ
jgi:ketosteroid isomerase-like protein